MSLDDFHNPIAKVRILFDRRIIFNVISAKQMQKNGDPQLRAAIFIYICQRIILPT